MGIFSEIKKLFWTSSAVAKSAADKGMDSLKDVGGDLLQKSEGLGTVLKDKVEDMGGDILGKTGDLGETLMDKAGDIGGTLKDRAGDLGGDLLEKTGGLRDAILHSAEGTMSMVNKSETLQKAAAATEKIGEQVLSKGEELINRGGDAIESIGGKILGEDSANVEKLKNFTEGLGEKVMEAKESLVDKAGDAMENIQDKIDETLIKGKQQEAAEAAAPKKDLQEILDDNKGALLEGEDDFFAKAAAYADGDYHGAQEGKITIEEVPDAVKREPAKAAGFTDHDGDGNEMVDDAIIEAADPIAAIAAPVVTDVTDKVASAVDQASSQVSEVASDMVAGVADATEDITSTVADVTTDDVSEVVDAAEVLGEEE